MDACWILLLVLTIMIKERDAIAHECTSSESVACKQEIQDLYEDKGRYYYATDNEALEELCRKQILAVNCVNSFARECLSQKEQAYFKTLVLGSDKFLDTFCFEDSDLRKKYLEHASCIRSITSKLDYCTQHYRISQEELDTLNSDSKILLQKTCCILLNALVKTDLPKTKKITQRENSYRQLSISRTTLPPSVIPASKSKAFILRTFSVPRMQLKKLAAKKHLNSCQNCGLFWVAPTSLIRANLSQNMIQKVAL